MNTNIILNNIEIEFKMKRIAYQIYETFIDEKEIIIAGIQGNGSILAQKLVVILKDISPLSIQFCEVIINKKNPTSPIETSLSKEDYNNKGLVLVDDVLNTGTTLIYGVKHFLEVPLQKFKTAVLVDRNHKKYPIKADFKGISLSTSILEHVHVVFENNNQYAYLE
ncbi:phosphoribosyltransferase [Flavobacterium columnare]|uniref:phosphoribosyltransferase domain-containing protein n=1 Tax=Flavobacterium columnare TaxID=996 RepID=UPI002D20337A|nr:phosphoribosyltransferase domain-containing protein [Flavobacterium columnare]MEB3802265.1 phosphoribosyltransferase [Flavobacterium columnare]